MQEKIESITIRISPEAKFLLEEISVETHRTVSELIRQLIRNRYDIGKIEVMSGPEVGEKSGVNDK